LGAQVAPVFIDKYFLIIYYIIAKKIQLQIRGQNMTLIKKLNHNKYGFTLIELMIAVLISGIIITAVYQLMSSSNKASVKANEQISAANALDSTIDEIRLLTMQATELTITDSTKYKASSGQDVIRFDYDSNSIYFNNNIIGSTKQYSADKTELVFSKSSEDNLLKVEIINFKKDGDNLERMDGLCREVELYLQSLGEDGSGKITVADDIVNPNCIVFTTAKVE
jgi:prepilin-type N-terminal cleavage/methylation domain-containing protein